MRCCATSECFRHWLIPGAYVRASAASARSFSRAAGFPTGICYGGFAILRARSQQPVASNQLARTSKGKLLDAADQLPFANSEKRKAKSEERTAKSGLMKIAI